jgi:L-cysteine S-thiosulfotransferase
MTTNSRGLLGRLLLAVVALLAAAGLAQAQDTTEKELERYRAMMKADPWANPGMLDADRGADLWVQVRGPKNASLEACDLGKGPGVVDGAFAELPRYFADANQVMDLETRVLWCMATIQGFDKAKLTERPHPGGGAPVKELGAIATFVASKSSGRTFSAKLDHPKEVEATALGEAIFNRRMGPFDFACSTCHADSGKRIRLQALPYLAKPAEAKRVVGEWPAYRVSSTHVMTMQHRVYDCFWQMRMPEVEIGSDVTVALITYMTKTAQGGEINVPGMKR